MKTLSRLALLISLTLVGCHTTHRAVTRDVLIGNFVYKSQDPDGKVTDHAWDHLTLRADGTYDLVEGGPTKVKSGKTGLWRFYGGDPAQIDLDHSGYPVQIKGSEVRLLIDNDLGIWFAKTK